MFATGDANARYIICIAVDSDPETLANCKAEQKILVPLGVLDDSSAARELAALPSIVGGADADIVFVVAGMGGATGTMLSPIIAQHAKQQGAMTFGIALCPNHYETAVSESVAKAGLSEFLLNANSLIPVPFERLAPNTEFGIDEGAWETVAIAISSIADSIFREGLTALDFIDFANVFGNGGRTGIGYGTATGQNRALRALARAISCPTLGLDMLQKSSGVLLVIYGDSEFSFAESSKVARSLVGRCRDDTLAHFKFFQNGKEGELSVVIVACEDGDGWPSI